MDGSTHAPPPRHPLTPDQALEHLRRGNARWATDEAENPRTSAERRQRTTELGQHPLAAVLSCSDSRVPVELVFDQGIGDLFVVRVAGNVCAEGALASLEYALGHLAVPLLIVLGHSGCGAVAAAIAGEQADGPLAQLLARIQPAVEAVETHEPYLSAPRLLTAVIEANVWQALGEVLARSSAAREGIRSGALRAVGATYDLESGRVRWLGDHPDQRQLTQGET